MTDSTSTPIVDRFATIVADHAAAAASKAREEARRQEAERQLAFKRDCDRLAEFFPPEVLGYGWAYEPAPDRGPCYDGYGTQCRPVLTLVATFLPDDVEPLRLLVDYPHFRNRPHPELRLHGGDHWCIERGATAEEVDAILAPIITGHVGRERERARRAEEARASLAERQRAAAERQEREQQQRAESDALDARINVAADELHAQAEREIADDLAALVERFGWPAGATLTGYELTWTEGVNYEGDVQRSDPRYLVDPNPDDDGFYSTVTRDDTVRVRVTGTAITTVERTWRSVDDLPYDLREERSSARQVEVWDEAGTRRLFRGDCVRASVTLPGAAIRRVLGLDASAIPFAKPVTIAAKLTPEGFEVFVPPASSEPADGAGALEDLPF